jgi:hypothetical protein
VLIGIDGTEFLVSLTVNRQALSLFPALHGAYIPFQITGNFFPGLEAIVPGGFLRVDLRFQRTLRTENRAYGSIARH